MNDICLIPETFLYVIEGSSNFYILHRNTYNPICGSAHIECETTVQSPLTSVKCPPDEKQVVFVDVCYAEPVDELGDYLQ